MNKYIEAGWAIGAGKPVFILLSDGEPELMYMLAEDTTVDPLCINLAEVLLNVRECYTSE